MCSISVIIPVYNTEQYVDAAIESVLSQTHTDFELIIINDGSTDRSLERILSYQNRDNRITILSQETQGPGAARNRGLEMARGEYIYFMDSDDLLEPEALATCFSLAHRNNLDLVTFSAAAFSDLPGAAEAFNNNYQKPDLLVPCSGEILFAALKMNKTYSCSPCLYLFSRNLLESMSLWFDEGYLHEDEGFTAELYCRATRAISLSNKFFRRRIRPGSTMTSPLSLKHLQGLMQATVRIDNLLNSHKTIKPAARKALRRQQRRVVRNAQEIAFKIGQNIILKNMFKERLKTGSQIAIDPLILVYLYANPLFCGLLQLWYLMQRGSGIERPQKAMVEAHPISTARS